MTSSAVNQIDADHLLQMLSEGQNKLADGDGKVSLDFSGVQRIDSPALKLLGQLADTAEKRDGRVVLRSVNVEVYKVLKLAGLTSRFWFAD